MDNADAGVVIIGAGLAGAKGAEGLRAAGFDGRIVLIGAESELPYERPELSKGYLAGKTERDALNVQSADWYDEHDIELQLGRTVEAVDRAAHTVRLDDGRTLDYDKLLLTTGSRPRALDVPGADADGVYYLRQVGESDALRELIGSSQRLVVIGAGWIGLEITAAARTAGVEVDVVESAALPLLNVVGSEVAEVFADLHRQHGVQFHFRAEVQSIVVADGRARGVVLADGTTIEADAVLVGVGAQPNVELATDAGLEVDNGVLVDEHLLTADPDIAAAGDVANAEHPVLKRRIRVEHWASALNQPAVAAQSLIGQPASYTELPYFYTDQYDLGMEYTGYVTVGDYDRVVFRGDVPTREFIAFWLKDNRVLAGMNVNVWDVTDPIKALITSGRTVDPDVLAQTSIPLEDV